MTDRIDSATASRHADPRHWRVLLRTLGAAFRPADYATGASFAAEIAALAEAHQHHPGLTLSWGRIGIVLTSHDAGGLTVRDLRLAAAISDLADRMGIEGAPETLSVHEVAIDALDIPLVRPFWRAVLGYVDDGDDALVDPTGMSPAYWFQQMDAPRPQRNRIHLDVTVPHDQAEARVAAAIEAGGTLLSGRRAPAFWVLADPEGNEACVCTWQARD
ncbi:VOC family protein [Cellulomonas sp. RIT-PI-Y]|uniref:VOC family protein n=1 Tax=Cellulomonas sp. RIT-PI-Y TaxID=3035297 RepID=UPI0021DAEAD1|nr:VOC family protein [Cellulomonas sp. RIT-PI-Y]